MSSLNAFQEPLDLFTISSRWTRHDLHTLFEWGENMQRPGCAAGSSAWHTAASLAHMAEHLPAEDGKEGYRP